MGFNDTMKKLLDQGLAVSKDLAGKAGGTAQEWGTKGLEASREFASKAGAKLQELGEKGALILEIKNLEGKAKKLIGLLGAEVYSLFEQGKPFTAEESETGKILEQITMVKETLEKKETELKTRFAKKN